MSTNVSSRGEVRVVKKVRKWLGDQAQGLGRCPVGVDVRTGYVILRIDQKRARRYPKYAIEQPLDVRKKQTELPAGWHATSCSISRPQPQAASYTSCTHTRIMMTCIQTSVQLLAQLQKTFTLFRQSQMQMIGSLFSRLCFFKLLLSIRRA